MPSRELLEVFHCSFEITTPYEIRRMDMEMPRIMLEQHFVSLVESLAAYREPAKVVMCRSIPIWSQHDNQWLTREASVEFKNNAYTAKYGADD